MNKKGKNNKSKPKPKNPLTSASSGGDMQPGGCTAQNGGSSAPNPHGTQGQADATTVGAAASPKKPTTKAKKDKASDKPPVPPDQTEGGGKGEEKKAGGGVGNNNNKSGYRADAGGSLRVPRKRWGGKETTTTRVDVRDVFGVREEE
jgi:hypothetical protein